jgi:polyhydroxyalkanoate synthase
MGTETGRWELLAALDRVRRLQGRWYDVLGLGPVESPCRTVLREVGVTLKAYGEPGRGPVGLIVPAPIKRAYIWDLTPEASVVRLCRSSDIGLYLLEWEQPGPDQELGLADYAERLLNCCVDAIQTETSRRRVILLGHSLGGTLASIFTALHGDRVAGLVLLGAPLRFGPEVGMFGHLVADTRKPELAAPVPETVPGSFLNLVSLRASPVTFGWARWVDGLASLADPHALRTHWLVERWTLDELPLARRFFWEVVQWLVHDDRFMRGTLVVGERQANPLDIHAPILSVVDPRCDIVPPQAVLPFLDAVGSTDKSVLWYEGDTGVALQHVGMLVGRRAHERLWPEILRWIHNHWRARDQ